MFQKGQSATYFSKEEKKLLSILFCWFLTSNNRYIRDNTSEALIEILKGEFSLCIELLQLFHDVNDPYVIQRLFGVVFGASVKRVNEDKETFSKLTEYVYEKIFKKDTVYPDILLRDYARSIIERYIYEYPQDTKNFDFEKIKPPYISEPIPVVVEEKYYIENKYRTGMLNIASSMRPEMEGHIYGDFGRYVFGSALKSFKNVDIKNIYHYAMQYIRDELKYSEEYLGEYDKRLSHYNYDRHNTKKIERIGKKYQWIAFYNILARVSDAHKVIHWNDTIDYFEGPWEPYVRDFDPTLNNHFMKSPDLPKLIPHNLTKIQWEEANPLTESLTKDWIQKQDEFFSQHGKKLEYRDETDVTWILLSEHTDFDYKEDMYEGFDGIKSGSQKIWSMSDSYIVKNDEFANFKRIFSNKNLFSRKLPEGYRVYQLFNREYVWSSGYTSFFEDYWLPVEVDAGKKECIMRGMIPLFDDDYNIFFEEREYISAEITKEIIGYVMPAYSNFLWEEEYDVSQEMSVSFKIPCKSIIESLQLEQKEFDGYFYNSEGDLVAFDTEIETLLDKTRGLLIKKDCLLRYLDDNNYRLFWKCIGEKQAWPENKRRGQEWSKWSGFYYFDSGKIIGNMTIQNDDD
jgi:hypothetical protein